MKYKYTIASILIMSFVILGFCVVKVATDRPMKLTDTLEQGNLTAQYEQDSYISRLDELNGGEVHWGEYFILSEDLKTVYVRSGGSGSCPPILTNAIYSDNTLSLNFTVYGEICTDDYRIYDFKVTSDSKFNSDLTVELTTLNSNPRIIENQTKGYEKYPVE